AGPVAPVGPCGPVAPTNQGQGKKQGQIKAHSGVQRVIRIGTSCVARRDALESGSTAMASSPPVLVWNRIFVHTISYVSGIVLGTGAGRADRRSGSSSRPSRDGAGSIPEKEEGGPC
ncbi:hypothetical protein, partial [Anaeromassilibacillus senegalensis]|uniref:hypothetical protein n=1 Tax=Anaeromassilibacillus senegalensis TaxID=1673717 RepID=UPI001A9A3175